MPIININLVLFITFLTWHYSLFCGYISDDHAAVASRTDIIPDTEKVDRGESFWTKRFNDGIILYYQTRLFWKLGLKNVPFAWHVFSLAVHMCNVYLLYIFLTPIFGDQVALYASCFWGINPMINQNVIWISGRPYSMGLMLTLIALICYQSPEVFGPFYMLAVLTNISTFFAPIIAFIAYPEYWQTKAYLGVMLLGAAPFIVWKFNKRFTKGLVMDRDNFNLKPRKANTFARIVLYYIWTLFVPVRMGWYHQAGFRYNNKWEKFNYLTLLGYAAIAGLIFSGLAGWIFLLGLLPNSNIYATNSFLQDRYIYFCSIGIAILVAPVMIAYPFLFWMAVAFYGSRAYSYSRHLKNDEKLYRENWRNHPKSDYAINNLSYFLIQQKRYDESRVVIEQGLEIDRMNKMLWYNLGITYAAQGNFGNDEGKFKFIKALDCWKMCLKIEPRWSKPANDLKKLIQVLVDNNVLTLNKADSAEGVQVSIPNLVGMDKIIKKEGK